MSELNDAGMNHVSSELSLNEIAVLNNVDIYDVIEPLWLIESK
ncbi:hypothetical protein [Agaribacterium sp. ZY112]